MGTPQQQLEVVVGADGTVRVPASDVARLGAGPGEHLRLVRGEPEQPVGRRRSVRGALVGRVDDVLSWENFEAVHNSNVGAVRSKHGR